MTWDPAAFNQDLAAAVESYNGPEAAKLCDELLAHLRTTDETYPARDAMRVLRTNYPDNPDIALLKDPRGYELAGEESPFWEFW